MTPNLASARQAIQAELSHARQGIAYYAARVEALETALSQLETVDSDEPVSTRQGKRKGAKGKAAKAGTGRGRKPRSTAQGATAASAAAASSASGKGKRGRKAGTSRRSDEGGALPTTGTDFWLKLVTDEPKSAVDIANAAASEIGLAPDQKELIQKLKQRVAPALTSLVSSGKIQDTGAGRERRFFTGQGQAA